MAIFGGLFGKSQTAAPVSGNVARISQAIGQRLGLQLLPPPPEVVARIEAMKSRELVQFENLQSVAGLESLLRAQGIRTTADPAAQTVALSIAPAETDVAAPAPATAAPREPIRVSIRPAAVHVSQPVDSTTVTKPATPVPAAATVALAPLPAGLETLESFERLLPQIVDAFLKQGQLNTGDKDVLKAIRPTDGSPQARLVALERWQTEVARRVRGLTLPRTQQQFSLATVAPDRKEKPEAALVRRLDALISWTAKLIKAFEQTGVRFPAKPVWLH